jgi:methyl-accepting chemotaxis protein
MVEQPKIQKAIGAHGMWKTRLKAIIDSGKCEIPIESIRLDDQCDFGMWLHGSTLSLQDKTTANYTKVKALHAEFHKMAASVAALAISGKAAEAKKLLNPGGAYAETSAKLTMAMMEWCNTRK